MNSAESPTPRQATSSFQKRMTRENGANRAIASGLNTAYDEGRPAVSLPMAGRCISRNALPMHLLPDTPKSSPPTARMRHGKPNPLELTKDTLSTYAHPAVSPDGEWLYFVSDMPGGVGGYDIWRVRITAAGLGGVENLGEPINTPGDEMFPTFRPNGDLYFSSNGHVGMGGLDIYIAKVDKKTRQYKVTHPGYPLNSESR